MTNTNSLPLQLPVELQARAIILAHEVAWIASDALRVIHWLASTGYAVVGVEMWQADDESPKWIASSNYRYERSAAWQHYVHQCAEGATRFVQSCSSQEQVLFNLTWMSASEA